MSDQAATLSLLDTVYERIARARPFLRWVGGKHVFVARLGSLLPPVTGTYYEPFLGSGTTLAAAELTERVCLGIELDPKYVDVIVQRWQTLSGKTATLDGDGRVFDEIAEERRKAAA